MKKFTLAVLFLISLHGIAQITVDPSVTPENSMQILLGENVTISNLSFTGDNEQIGTFECDDCGLDFEAGIVLSSGSIETALGPNNSSGNTIGGSGNQLIDADLTMLNDIDYFDGAVLEFDFTALGEP